MGAAVVLLVGPQQQEEGAGMVAAVVELVEHLEALLLEAEVEVEALGMVVVMAGQVSMALGLGVPAEGLVGEAVGELVGAGLVAGKAVELQISTEHYPPSASLEVAAVLFPYAVVVAAAG